MAAQLPRAYNSSSGHKRPRGQPDDDQRLGSHDTESNSSRRYGTALGAAVRQRLKKMRPGASSSDLTHRAQLLLGRARQQLSLAAQLDAELSVSRDVLVNKHVAEDGNSEFKRFAADVEQHRRRTSVIAAVESDDALLGNNHDQARTARAPRVISQVESKESARDDVCHQNNPQESPITNEFHVRERLESDKWFDSARSSEDEQRAKTEASLHMDQGDEAHFSAMFSNGSHQNLSATATEVSTNSSAGLLTAALRARLGDDAPVVVAVHETTIDRTVLKAEPSGRRAGWRARVQQRRSS